MVIACALGCGLTQIGAHLRTIMGLLACVIVLACSIANADERMPIPDLHARVTDLTQTLTAEQIGTLDGELAALEARKGAQLAVLMIPTLAPPADVPGQPDDIEGYATRAFDYWKLGRKGVDDGVLLIVVKDDHKVRIEVGYGLEGAIPDAAAARIIREYIAPRFREDDYYGGIHAATAVLTTLIDGEALPAPLEGPHASESTQSTSSHDDGSYAGPVAIVVAGMLFGFLIASLLQNAFNLFPIRIIPIGVRRAIGMVTGPALAGGLCYITFGTDTAQIPIAPVTMAILIMSWMGWHFAPQGASRVWAKGMTWKEFFQDLLSVIIGIVISAVTDGGVSSSGGGGGGGFSGGGGSSGGGGASGSW